MYIVLLRNSMSMSNVCCWEGWCASTKIYVHLCWTTKIFSAPMSDGSQGQLSPLWPKATSCAINTLRPRQNGRHFADDNFKCLFLNENVWNSIKISLKFVRKVQLTIFQHWFRWWLGADQATSHYLNQLWLDYRRIYASLGLNELKTMPMFSKNLLTRA